MKIHRVVLRLRTPLHIGWMKLGNLQRTRPYITGKVLWGAFTARLTRDYPQLGGDYVAVGHRVNEELAFSYFYPTVGREVNLWPWDDPDEFAWRYLNSYAATALDYSRNAAEEGTLHETEYIAPYTRDGAPVFLVGYIFEHDGCTLPWFKVLGRLQLGGERGYGWGQVDLEDKQDWDVGRPLFGQWYVRPDTWPPRLAPAHREARLMAHALAADFNDGERIRRAVTGIAGRIEPLVGRETTAGDRFGMHIGSAYICYAPGSRVKDPLTCQIGPFGIWEAYT
ncbi:MAG TPA: hypothetical protein VNK89_10670 [Thermoflexus sp.]|nr:hypothetical protein [Thermoflexus sp.]